MTDVVTHSPAPPAPPELPIGPFEEWRVMVDGRIIPLLTGRREGPDHTLLVLDHRFATSVPNEYAYGVAYLIATALAIGQGYASMHAENKDRPFAPRGMEIGPQDPAAE